MPADASTGTIQIFQPQAFICFKLSWTACPPDRSGEGADSLNLSGDRNKRSPD